MSTDPAVDVSRLRVRDRRLYQVWSDGQERKYQGSDYVLYSLVKRDRRGNTSTLPFDSAVEQALNAARVPTDESWTKAKTLLSSAYLQMMQSPDLTSDEADALLEQHKATMLKNRETAKSVDKLSKSEGGFGVKNQIMQPSKPSREAKAAAILAL